MHMADACINGLCPAVTASPLVKKGGEFMLVPDRVHGVKVVFFWGGGGARERSQASDQDVQRREAGREEFEPGFFWVGGDGGVSRFA